MAIQDVLDTDTIRQAFTKTDANDTDLDGRVNSHGGSRDGHPVATSSLAGLITAASQSKLDGIEAGATTDMSDAEILAAILRIDGAGSGVNADLLDGLSSNAFEQIANKNAANGYAGLSSGKLSMSVIPDTVAGGMDYQGVWNAATNTPNLATLSPAKGDYYKVSVAGSTSLSGITDWQVGDWAAFNGTSWDKIDNTDSVSSVNGQVGAVTLSAGNLAVTPVGNISATNVQAAILELDTEKTSDHDALSNIRPVDLTSTNTTRNKHLSNADGKSWQDHLARADNPHATTAAQVAAIPTVEKGVANGVATLGTGGQIPSGQIPAVAISDVFQNVTSQTAMLALAAQRGDLAIRTDFDPDRAYMCSADDPTLLANWTRVTFADVVSVNGQVGVITLNALNIPNTPAGTIAATTVQAALNELDSEKLNTSHNHDATYVNETDHTKAAHDALAIDAGTLDTLDSTAFLKEADYNLTVNTYDGATPITTFRPGVTIMVVTSTGTGWPTAATYTIVTNRAGNQGYQVAKAMSTDTRSYERRWINSSTTWGSWLQ